MLYFSNSVVSGRDKKAKETQTKVWQDKKNNKINSRQTQALLQQAAKATGPYKKKTRWRRGKQQVISESEL